MRTDGRQDNEIRNIIINPEIIIHAEGSVEIHTGNTKVLCTASVEERIPKWLQGAGKGWVSAEYGMLPRSTHTRMRRDKAANSGRTQEISRLIARSLRAGIDLNLLGERQISIDCDVIQADGGTRTAAITGGFVALGMAIQFLMDQNQITTNPLKGCIAATSVGLKGDRALLDLNYDEDSNIGTDMNFVMNDKGEFIEIQGTAETEPFNFQHLQLMIERATKGCQALMAEQKKILGDLV